MNVIGLSGSLRAGSHNAKLLRAAGDLLPPEADLTLYEGLKSIPPFDEDDEHTRPESVQALFDAIAQADAVLLATPEYNHSIPGQLKNALDWASTPFPDNALKGKPVAVIGAKVLDRELPVPLADEIVRDHEKLESSGTHSLIVGILAELLEAARPVEAAAAA